MLNAEMGATMWQFLRLVVFGIAGVLSLVLLIGVFTPRASRLLSPRRREDPINEEPR